MRTFLNLDALLITVLTFATVALIAVVPATFSVLQPLGKAFGDFDLTDLVTSQLRDAASVPVDTNIVLVNIGRLSRADIARELDAIADFSPAVVAIDAFFRAPKGDALDTPLVHALERIPHVVLTSELTSYNATTDRFDSLALSNPMFTRHATVGFANFVISDDQSFRTVRTFSPSEPLHDTMHAAFPVAVAAMYDPTSVRALMARGKGTEYIRYRGNLDKFYALDAPQVLEPGADLSVVRGKIVVCGYLGPTLGAQSFEDAFFTPLNPKYAGRSFPDMYGAVIHANIISMILHHEYIGRLPVWAMVLLAVVLCYLEVTFLLFINRRAPTAADAIVVVQQILVAAASLTLMVFAFDMYHFRLDLTLTIFAMVLAGEVLEVYEALRHHALRAIGRLFSRVRTSS